MKVNEHSEVVNQIILALGSQPHIRVWKNSTGTAKTMSGNIVSFGLKGSPDIIGIITRLNLGIFLGIEVKTGKAVQSKEQKAFEQMVKKFGGFYFVFRNVEDALDFVKHSK